jgi:hypothetical protein
MKRFLLFGFLILLAFCIVMWQRSRSSIQNQGGTNMASNPKEAIKEEKPPQPQGVVEGTNVLPDYGSASAEQNKKLEEMGVLSGMTREQAEKAAANWHLHNGGVRIEDVRKPLIFYGKVIDENTNAVPGVKASLKWNEPLPDPPQSTSSITDENGLFALNGVTGRVLWLSLEKEDYYVSRRNALDFQFPPDAGQLDPNNPILFHLRKKGPGTDLITSNSGMKDYVGVKASKDGTPVHLDFFNHKTGNEGQIVISNVKPVDGRERSDWSFTLSVPDGGLLEHHDEFPFEAPEDGYQSEVDFTFSKDSTNWVAGFKKDFYIVFGQPRKYGRIHIETDTFTSGAHIEFAINPDGSRYLEAR